MIPEARSGGTSTRGMICMRDVSPGATGDRLARRDLLNHFSTGKRWLVDSGDLMPLIFRDYYNAGSHRPLGLISSAGQLQLTGGAVSDNGGTASTKNGKVMPKRSGIDAEDPDLACLGRLLRQLNEASRRNQVGRSLT